MEIACDLESRQRQRFGGMISGILGLANLARNALNAGETEKAAQILDSMLALKQKADALRNTPQLHADPSETEGFWLSLEVAGAEFRMKVSEILPAQVTAPVRPSRSS